MGVGRGAVLYKTFPFSMHFNSKNGQFHPNLGSKHISFENFVFITVMMGH